MRVQGLPCLIPIAGTLKESGEGISVTAMTFRLTYFGPRSFALVKEHHEIRLPLERG